MVVVPENWECFMGRRTPAVDAETWLLRHGDVLYRYALRYTATREEAEDLVQETLLAAWRGRSRFRGEASERSWLIGILKHKIGDRLRSAARDPLGENGVEEIEARVFRINGTWLEPPGDWGRDPLDDAQCDAFLESVAKCLDDIPEAQREAFLLRELAAMDAESVSQSMRITVDNLYVLLHRARLRLRRCLERIWFAGEENES